MHSTYIRSSLGFAGLFVLAACAADVGDDDENVETQSEALVNVPALVVAGDFVASSATKGIAKKELESNAGARLLPLGDLSYASPYAENYPWAAWASKTYPVMGNHEFNKVAGKGGQQPFKIFDGKNAAGNRRFAAIDGDNRVDTYDFFYTHEPTPGWLLVVVNSGTDCKQQSCAAQASRMASAIKAYRAGRGGHGCVIVALHTARWSTMFSGDEDNLPWADGVDPIWDAAVDNKADLFLQGHVHVYEEFKKLGRNGVPSANGTKLFTVGSGGRGQVKPLRSNISSSALVESRRSPINGVLELGLYAGKYGHRFETAASSTVPAASTACNVP